MPIVLRMDVISRVPMQWVQNVTGNTCALAFASRSGFAPRPLPVAKIPSIFRVDGTGLVLYVQLLFLSHPQTTSCRGLLFQYTLLQLINSTSSSSASYFSPPHNRCRRPSPTTNARFRNDNTTNPHSFTISSTSHDSYRC